MPYGPAESVLDGAELANTLWAACEKKNANHGAFGFATLVKKSVLRSLAGGRVSIMGWLQVHLTLTLLRWSLKKVTSSFL